MDEKMKDCLIRMKELVRKHGDVIFGVAGLVGAEASIIHALHSHVKLGKKRHSNNWLKLHGYPMRRKNRKRWRAH
ncbi:MAG: hypothetical protein IKP88_21790 [Lachnospiraceae bacterium]|nr:hypothetical protein [Lachnospiraceae bacterium]